MDTKLKFRHLSWTKAGLIAIVLTAGLSGCSKSGGGQANQDQASATGQPANSDWPMYGNKSDAAQYSPLDAINDQNVQNLKVDWELNFDDAAAFTATPLEVDGTLYLTGDRGIARAVDARSGKLLWTYDPEVYKHMSRRAANGWNTNRGLAYLDGRIFVGAIDGRLAGLDAKTGKKIWETDTFDSGTGQEGKALTGPPIAFGNMVVIGFGGAEYGGRGYVTAYAADTGKKLWRFYTVPGDPAKKDNAASDSIMPMIQKTWFGDYWKTHGGGGTVWHSMTYDKELDQLYIGVGNAGPWNYQLRSQGKGDNLFVSSIVALNPHTGQYLWHYQANPGERWDYKSATNMILTDQKIGGQDHKVLMQAHTNGIFYVIDRKTGKLLSANNFSKVTWANGVDPKTGRPNETAAANYDKPGGSTIYPSNYGAHNWQPMSFNPRTGLVYIPETQLATHYSVDSKGPTSSSYTDRPNFLKIGTNAQFVFSDPRDGKGSLVAWDPVTQKPRWKFPYDSFWNGGTLTTGGNIVFQGTGDGHFRAFNATTGAKVWDVDMQRGITSAPITYSLDGKQHVLMLVGYGGLSAFGDFLTKYGYKYKDVGIRLVSFSLDGKEALKHLQTHSGEFHPADPGSAPIDASLADRGFQIYHSASCMVCHGANMHAGSIAPDLRESAAAQNFETLQPILQQGLLAENGMPKFADLRDDEIRALVAYIRQQTKDGQLHGNAKPAHAATPAGP